MLTAALKGERWASYYQTGLENYCCPTYRSEASSMLDASVVYRHEPTPSIEEKASSVKFHAVAFLMHGAGSDALLGTITRIRSMHQSPVTCFHFTPAQAAMQTSIVPEDSTRLSASGGITKQAASTLSRGQYLKVRPHNNGGYQQQLLS